MLLSTRCTRGPPFRRLAPPGCTTTGKARLCGICGSSLTGRLLRDALFRGGLQSQQEVRLMRPPSVADTEVQGRRIGAPVNVVETFLVCERPEHGDRPQIFPER